MDEQLTRFLEMATVDKLKEYITISEKILAERTRVLEAIPECPEHGRYCAPYALEWIRRNVHIDGCLIDRVMPMIPPPEFITLLVILRRNGGYISTADLMAATGLARSTVRRAAKRLALRGLVERNISGGMAHYTIIAVAKTDTSI